MSRHYTPKHITKKKNSLQQMYLAVAMSLVLAVGSFAWTSATLARYASTASGGSSAAVAAFVVEAEGADSQSLTLDTTNSTASYAFTVSNKNENAVGEVTTAYDVTVTFPSALSGVTLTLENGLETFTPTTSDGGITNVFKNVGTFQPGVERTDALSLSFALDENADTDGSWNNITVTVNAAQQD